MTRPSTTATSATGGSHGHSGSVDGRCFLSVTYPMTWCYIDYTYELVPHRGAGGEGALMLPPPPFFNPSQMPDSARGDSIDATMENGVLTIKIDKTEEAKETTIPVK
jgi:hypothetical protein